LGYWIANLNGSVGQSKELLGKLNGKFLTKTKLGTLSGDVLGVLERTGGNSLQIGSLGAWEGRDLAFVSEIIYSDYASRWLEMYLGGVDSLWTGADIEAMGIGKFGGGSGLWNGNWQSYNFKNNSNTTYDANPGSFRGYYSLIGNSVNAVDGSAIAFYLDDKGRVGYLYGALSGTVYPEKEMLAVNGAINRYDMGAAPTGLTLENWWNAYGETGFRSFNLEESTSSTIGFNSLLENHAWIADTPSPTWGIWQANVDGVGFAQNGEWMPPQSWNWKASSCTDTHWYSYNVTWNSEKGTLAGNIAGAGVDWANAKTAVLGSDIKGLFDPNAATWKAISNGTSMETAAFINLVNSLDMEQKNAFMAALKIPAISVGSVDLTGSRTAAGDALNVTMTGVNFYAYSTGQTPKIFATDKVTGRYDISGLGGNLPAPVNLTGTNGINLTGVAAQFTPTVWNTDNNRWGALITGQGAMTAPSTPISFTGGAAGNLSGGSIGTLNGTAAGIVK